MTPSVSVIIPAHNPGHYLRRALRALDESTTPPREIIVVNDCSTDDSFQEAEFSGVTVLKTEVKSGPAHARNLGAAAAAGDILLFLDVDVCVYPGTLTRVVETFLNPQVDALIGSYDDDPESPDFISQYRNLMHCFVHQTGRSEASTFWSGCGAIRREVFLESGGFDENYVQPAIEDIELGYRLTRDGRHIVLDRDLRVKHLKRWSFWNLIKTDILYRGIPWTELILRHQKIPNDLNLQLSQRVSVALVYLMLANAAFCAIYWQGYFLTPLFAFLFFLLGRYWIDGTQTRTATALMLAGAAAIIALAWYHHMLGLIPLVLIILPALLFRHRYEWDKSERPLWTWITFLVYLGIAATSLLYVPNHPLVLATGVIFFVILILNKQFYLFLSAKRGRWFALAAVPFHLLYHFYNGLAFVIGTCRWAWKRAFSPQAAAESAPHQELADQEASEGLTAAAKDVSKARVKEAG